MPKRTRSCVVIRSDIRTPLRTRTPKTAINVEIVYPTIVETAATFNVYFPCNLNRNGMETHTDTGPFFIMAGVNTHCIAASAAG